MHQSPDLTSTPGDPQPTSMLTRMDAQGMTFDPDTWCGTCRPDTRTVYGEPCLDCHPAIRRTRAPRRWCGTCDRQTLCLPDGTRCDCHPFAHDVVHFAARPWCGHCASATDRHHYAHDEDGRAYRSRCRTCHPLGRKPDQWPVNDVPDGFTETFLATDWLTYISPTLRRIGVDRLRVLLRKWYEAGYTPRDIVYALDHDPMGGRYDEETPLPSASPRIVEYWLRRRLATWLDADDTPYLPIRLQQAAYRDQLIAQQRIRRAEFDQRAATAARESPAAALAATIARIAARQARTRTTEADHREREARIAQLAADRAIREAHIARLGELSAETPDNA